MRLVFAPVNLAHIGWSAVGIGLATVAPLAVPERLRHDPSPIAAGIRGASERVLVGAHLGLFNMALAVGGAAFAYGATSLGWPLQDARLAAIDQALGFDWPAFLAWTNARPWLAKLLANAYHSAGPQLLALYAFLCLTKRWRELDEFLAMIAVSSLMVGVGMALIPAAGAYAHCGPDPSQFSSSALRPACGTT
ncbi:phosphatase PAP2 family protein [Chelatococcus sp. SYSU_G07232]|uniref:Phosphatase PAP2 family protein n=1 Tax=Chelatococcus albus TaxID=3047466 RepID=A0ABT7AJC7_9HYPH|nr:phosphatase PAP2 family protein [Chelatococcus sp. SYSU_G07232]MDJ1159485.1 phosphatase PAP2 family protein [Chelatococcus sp. SYSU_G07232]